MIVELHQLRLSGLSLEDAVTNIRGSLVPPGYTPYPFRSKTDESLLDKLRSIVATYTFRARVEELKAEGTLDRIYFIVISFILNILNNHTTNFCVHMYMFINTLVCKKSCFSNKIYRIDFNSLMTSEIPETQVRVDFLKLYQTLLFSYISGSIAKSFKSHVAIGADTYLRFL